MIVNEIIRDSLTGRKAHGKYRNRYSTTGAGTDTGTSTGTGTTVLQVQLHQVQLYLTGTGVSKATGIGMQVQAQVQAQVYTGKYAKAYIAACCFKSPIQLTVTSVQ